MICVQSEDALQPEALVPYISQLGAESTSDLIIVLPALQIVMNVHSLVKGRPGSQSLLGSVFVPTVLEVLCNISSSMPIRAKRQLLDLAMVTFLKHSFVGNELSALSALQSLADTSDRTTASNLAYSPSRSFSFP